MIILEDLPLKERLKYLESRKPAHKLGNIKRRYKSRFTNVYKIKKDTLSHVSAENIIDVCLLKQYTDSYDFDFVVSESKVLQGLEFLPYVYMNLLDTISKIKNHITCRVNSFGLVVDILNKQELKDKWLPLKNELLNNNDFKKSFNEEDLKKLIEAGDMEYVKNVGSLIPELNKNIVFLSLFMGFIDREKIQKRDFYSYIFPENKILGDLFIEKEQEDNKLLTFSIVCQKSSIDRTSFKKKYLSNFFFLQEPFDEHYFDFLSLYTIEKETNWIENIKLTLDEKINEAVSVNIICEIQKIENI